jgi:hypothetical protein
MSEVLLNSCGLPLLSSERAERFKREAARQVGEWRAQQNDRRQLARGLF